MPDPGDSWLHVRTRFGITTDKKIKAYNNLQNEWTNVNATQSYYTDMYLKTSLADTAVTTEGYNEAENARNVIELKRRDEYKDSLERETKYLSNCLSTHPTDYGNIRITSAIETLDCLKSSADELSSGYFKKALWYALIAFAVLALGRYLIKLVSWVSTNAK